jgi:hypothetical protein
MTVTIYTCDREPSYLEQTIRTIPDNLNYEIIWQKKDIHKPVSDKRIKLLTPRPYNKLQHNARFNYAMTLLYSADGLIIEDDVILSKKFTEYMNEVKKLIDAERYIIALYSCYKWEAGKTINLVDFPVHNFYGSQAMFFDEITKNDLARWILDGLIMESEPHDFAVKSYCNEYNVPLFAVNYSLVQHAGEITTGLGHHHQCPNFIDDFMV